MTLDEVALDLEKIENAEFGLQSAADIQKFLNAEHAKRQPYLKEQIVDLINLCSGLSCRQIETELLSRNPQLDFKESKKMISKDRMQITYTTVMTTEEQLQRIKELRSHASPHMNREQLIDYMAEVALERIDPRRRDARAKKRKLNRPKIRSSGAGTRADSLRKCRKPA